MDNLFFKDKNQLYCVNLNIEAYKQMLIYCSKSNPNETGGILIGNYSSDQTSANVLQATPPPKNSKHSKSKFYRSANGLQKFLDSLWNQGHYYVGEWHYHPNFSSAPSSTDIKQMFEISKNIQLKCPEPILIIIGGCHLNWNLHISVFANNSFTPLSQM